MPLAASRFTSATPPAAIRLAAEQGDTIVAAHFEADGERLFPVSVCLRAIDRHHLLRDIVYCVTESQNLSISRLDTVTHDRIVETTVDFEVHSLPELEAAMSAMSEIPGVDEVERRH